MELGLGWSGSGAQSKGVYMPNAAAFYEQTKPDNWYMVGLLTSYAARDGERRCERSR